MSVLNPGEMVLLVPLVYLVVIGVIGVLSYLVLRFAIRDGLRGHRLWQERTGRTPPPPTPDRDDE